MLSQKTVRNCLDSKLNFNAHVLQKINKCNKLIGLIKRLSTNLPRNALLTIYKSFIRPNLDYGVVLCDNATMEIFKAN